MTWIPLVILILRHLVLLFEALSNPQNVRMRVVTSDGTVHLLPCKVERVKKYRWRDSAKITANFNSVGEPVKEAMIFVGRTAFAKAQIPRGQILYQSGPVELGDTFN